ncbi:hypothetical protein [Aeromonas sp. QDB66]|uniref:hypothetical protein n=1 Tax=Aeromonas sp. QDB66 TaxID=2989824 RepID=UPI0022E87594|nr:hypothetical protein [Aeromonas sp. QDB66]
MSQIKKAASQNGTASTKPGESSTMSPKGATKLELVACHLLEQGSQGVSALTGLSGLHDLNLRNSVGLLRREHGISILSEFFEHQYSCGGTTRFKRYWLADREQAHKLVALINNWRHQRQAAPLADDYAAILCARTPAAAPLPPTA